MISPISWEQRGRTSTSACRNGAASRSVHQKIALEGDEEAALRIAGRAPVPIGMAVHMERGNVGRNVLSR
jgi:hypothetical protein